MRCGDLRESSVESGSESRGALGGSAEFKSDPSVLAAMRRLVNKAIQPRQALARWRRPCLQLSFRTCRYQLGSAGSPETLGDRNDAVTCHGQASGPRRAPARTVDAIIAQRQTMSWLGRKRSRLPMGSFLREFDGFGGDHHDERGRHADCDFMRTVPRPHSNRN
jgi:hypothetical protein